MSAATMADHGSPKKHPLYGSSSIYFPSDCQSLGRRLSEPSLFSLQSDRLPFAPILSKDDTYLVDHEGSDRSPPQTLSSTYVSRPRFDPRRLLDPKGYNAIQAKKEEDSTVTVLNRVFTAEPESLLTTRRSAKEMRATNSVWEA